MFADSFSGWTKAFCNKYETMLPVTKKLLEHTLARHRFPQMIGSDNGPTFVSQLNFDLNFMLSIKHIPSHCPKGHRIAV